MNRTTKIQSDERDVEASCSPVAYLANFRDFPCFGVPLADESAAGGGFGAGARRYCVGDGIEDFLVRRMVSTEPTEIKWGRTLVGGCYVPYCTVTTSRVLAREGRPIYGIQ